MLEREDIHDAFIAAVNHIEPEHAHYNGTHKRERYQKDGDPLGMWPMKLSELQTSYRRADSNTWASAGPRSTKGNVAGFSSDLSYFQRVLPARRAAVIVHEVTHITAGSFTDVQGGGHPPRFWETFAEYARRIEDDLDILEPYIGQGRTRLTAAIFSGREPQMA